MKEKIMIFIIGLLGGAVITSGIFFIYTIVTDNNCGTAQTQMNSGGQPPELPNGSNNRDGNSNGQPPSMPGNSDNQNSNNNNNDNNNQPPEMPNNSNSQSNSQ